MRKSLVFFVILFFAVLVSRSEERTNLSLKEVKVYLSGAELTHSGDVRLSKGSNTIVIDRISEKIKPNSINVTLGGKAMLVSVSERTNYLRDLEKTSDIRLLEDSIETTKWQISKKNNENAALEAEADLITSNRMISGKEKNITVAELQQMAEYFRTRLLEIKNLKYNLNIDITKLKEILTRLNRQLAEINEKRNKKVNEIVLTINSEIDESIELKIKYFSDYAGWIPFYDVRAANINSDVEFMHKANVWQNTGIDWDDVDLTISTRNPSVSGAIPVLSSVYLGFINSNISRGNYVGSNYLSDKKTFVVRGARADEVTIELDSLIDVSSGVDKSGSGFNLQPIEQFGLEENVEYSRNMLSVDYKPTVKYTIPTDKKEYKVDLQYTKIKADYEYYTIPKLQPDAYLVARISNWQNMNLLEGNANVYFENSFIGQTYIEPDIIKDTMNLSFGVDKNVLVQREIIKDFTENKFLSSDIERIFGYKITLKNTKKTDIKINLEDLIPISKNDDIQIKLLENPDGSLNKETGKLNWIITLEPGKSVEKIFKFSVRHPKDKQVNPF